MLIESVASVITLQYAASASFNFSQSSETIRFLYMCNAYILRKENNNMQKFLVDLYNIWSPVLSKNQVKHNPDSKQLSTLNVATCSPSFHAYIIRTYELNIG